MKLTIRDIEYKEKPLSFTCPSHTHGSSLYELIYVDRGAVHVIVEDADFTMVQGETCVQMPGQTHSAWAEKNSAPNVLNIHFTCDLKDLSQLAKRKFGVSANEHDLLRALEEERKDSRFDAFKAPWLVFAHSSDTYQMPGLPHAHAWDERYYTEIGTHRADYIVEYADGTEAVIPIRQRHQVGEDAEHSIDTTVQAG